MTSSADTLTERFLENLAAAVRIETVNHGSDSADSEAFQSLHELLEQRYPLVHSKYRVEKVNDLSLLITWEGTDPDLDPLVVMAHQDVVPVEPGTEPDWEQPPFSGALEDEYLWGRGTLDDKGQLIALLEAAEHLLEDGFEPRRTIIVVSGHDEESGGFSGAQPIADLLATRGITPFFVVDEGGGIVKSLPGLSKEPVALVKTSEKGSVTIRLTARGEGGHSSAPNLPTTIGKLAKALRSLEANQLPARLEVMEPTLQALLPRMGRVTRTLFSNLRVTSGAVTRLLGRRPETNAMIRTTTAITMIRGGVKENVLPQEAWAVVNFRIIPGDTVQSVVDFVRKKVGKDVEVETEGEWNSEPSGVSSTTSEAWQSLSSVIGEVFPEAQVTPWTLIAATDSRHFEGIAGDIYGFSPFLLEMSDMERIHGTGERMLVEGAGRAVTFYARLYESVCS